MRPKFTNLKDDNDRLNAHTKLTIEELTDMTFTWSSKGVDARAIYAGLKCLADYYYFIGVDKLGTDYMSALDNQAFQLADELRKRK